ncbi:MAG TPA: hypothetical protein VFR94_09630 [Nitrososphaeraceae archaeon]|nr:hypothetical protein [Nitrososphaeraceae archaeon]
MSDSKNALGFSILLRIQQQLDQIDDSRRYIRDQNSIEEKKRKEKLFGL